MFDAFKRLIRGDDDAPIPEEEKAAAAPKRRVNGMDKLSLSGAGSVAMPDQQEAAAPGAVSVPTGSMTTSTGTQRQVATMTLGL
ncbi:MAG: hypothetical protein H7338_10585, partial [Candidatus Sericytochromatia bacterium]|nr:hypothetical protein [Candidatus Sericytochromatia bacterium]